MSVLNDCAIYQVTLYSLQKLAWMLWKEGDTTPCGKTPQLECSSCPDPL
jgi:hypothetical protein